MIQRSRGVAVLVLTTGALLGYLVATGRFDMSAAAQDNKKAAPIAKGPVPDKVPFRFNGKLTKLTVNVGLEQLAESDRKKVRDQLLRAKD